MAIKPGRPKKKTAKRKYIKPAGFDFTVMFIVLTLVLFGIVMIFSSSYYYTMTSAKYNNDMFYFLKKQSVWAVLGIIAMIFGMNVPYTVWRRFAKLAYGLAILFQALLPLIGIEAGGQKRWLGIGPIQFQPSEFTKIAVILYLSVYVIEHRKDLGNLKGFVKACCVLGLPVGLILINNLSSALLIGLVGATILFVASPRVWYFGAALAAVVPLGAIAVLLPQFRYRLTRITTWLDPWSDPTGSGFQTIQSLYAVASGGIFGLGLGQSRQKTFIPEAYNDIIFAIICEELGLFGALLIIALFAMMILRGYWIALRASSRFSTVLATGLVTLIAVQTVLNLGVVTNLLPSTGISLPFFSYGGTALAVNLGEMGIVLSISRQRNQIKKQEVIL